MKSGFSSLGIYAVALLLPVLLFAQGTVGFQNTSATRVWNGLTATAAGSPIVAAMYYAEDGVTNEALFMQIGARATMMSGIFLGGTRTIPTPTPGGWAMIQIRAFERTYGDTYEQAVSAAPQNGRYALAGKSVIMRVDTGDPTPTPPS